MANRRSFLQQTSALVGGGLLLSAFDSAPFSSSGRRMSPADQINVGAIGVNGMGWADLVAALKVPGVNVVALCDIDKNVLDKRMGQLAKMNIDASKVKAYGD